jgi:cytochrome c oxidase assembly protein subunit 11
VAVVAGMVGMSFAAVPLYRLFCQVTGYGGTTQLAESAPGAAAESVTVRFNADTARGMPWRFSPVQREVTARLGEQVTVFYEASNPSARPVTGTATFNVTPLGAGAYFAKIECFCFVEQRLEPGQTVAMPVTFFVDPALRDDPDAAWVDTITLSYTFFEKEEADDSDSAALAGGNDGAAAN